MKKFTLLFLLSFPVFSQDEVKKPVIDFFRIVSATTKTLDDSQLEQILLPEHSFVNSLKMQSVYDFTKYLISESVNLTLLSQIDSYLYVQVWKEHAYVVVSGTDRYRYKNRDLKNKFVASFVLVHNNVSKKWMINHIHISNEK